MSWERVAAFLGAVLAGGAFVNDVLDGPDWLTTVLAVVGVVLIVVGLIGLAVELRSWRREKTVATKETDSEPAMVEYRRSKGRVKGSEFEGRGTHVRAEERSNVRVEDTKHRRTDSESRSVGPSGLIIKGGGDIVIRGADFIGDSTHAHVEDADNVLLADNRHRDSAPMADDEPVPKPKKGPSFFMGRVPWHKDKD